MNHPQAAPLRTSPTRLTVALLLAAAAAVAPAAEVGRSEPATAPTVASAWATSWIAPPEPTWDAGFALPLGMPQELQNVTLRQHLRLSVGGDRVRVVLNNEYSDRPLKVGRVSVAIDGGSAAFATFHGADAVTVPTGAKAVSDPLPLAAPAGARLAVDVYLPVSSRISGFHWDAHDHTLLLHGNAAGRAVVRGAEELSTRAFLSAVLVESAQTPRTVVALGDSITDGNGSTPGADHRWPDFLARRLAPTGVAVLNAGISGNRLLRPGMGESALARLDRDVLQQPGVRAVVVLLGTNDIGWPGGPFAPSESLPSLDELSAGYRQLVLQAHLRGVRVMAGTVTPFQGALQGTPLEGHYSPLKDARRQAMNEWIRSCGLFDAVLDFDQLLRDPAQPSRLRRDYDSGDHLHPNDAGYRAMADAIDVKALLGAAEH